MKSHKLKNNSCGNQHYFHCSWLERSPISYICVNILLVVLLLVLLLLFFLSPFLHHLQYDTYITYVNQDTYTKYSTYITLLCLTLLLQKSIHKCFSFLFKYYIFLFFFKQSFALLILLCLRHLNFLFFF